MPNRPSTEVSDNPSAHRYEIHVDGELAGYASYRRDDEHVVFFDTQIEPAHRGKGLGQELVQVALEGARIRNKSVEARCPFIARYLREHPVGA